MSPAQDALTLETRSAPAQAMTAPTLNTAALATPGAAPGASSGAGPKAAAGNPLAGFDALLAALFPATEAVPAVGAAPLAPPAAEGALVLDTRGDHASEADADPDAAATEGDVADVDAQALAACMLVTTAPAGAAPLAPKSALAADAGRSANVPGPSAHAAAGLPTGKAELAPEAEEAAADATTPAVETPVKPGAAKPADAAPPAWGRGKAPGAPAQPALDNANPKADLAAKAAAAEADAAPEASPVQADAGSAVQTAHAAEPPTAPALAAKPEPAPAKTARSERGKPASEAGAADALKPREAVDKPVHARAADGAAKTASTTTEAVEEPEAHEARAQGKHTDTAAQGETRAASQSAGPTPHPPQPVRGAPETVANLAAQIVKKLEARSTRFDLELDPAGLGKVDVRVEIGAHGKMTAAMVFENPQAAHELKSRASELQRALEQAGFDLSGGLSFDVADQGGRQGQAWQDDGDASRAFRGRAFQAALDTAGDVAETANHGALRLRRGVSAGVDVRI